MKYQLFILAFTLIFFSCNSDDDAPQSSTTTLHGNWSLINVNGGFPGVNDDFESGLITWNFDDTEITVTNNNTHNVIHSGYPSGIYTYDVITTATDTTLVIENTNSKIITLTNNQLVIDQGVAADGFQYTLSK
ncbi:hypothetical protein [Winogradskyella vidalii]|uniref:hypothetical protein n=1 Tax=Winogradskyella vidalii TaxID=2615024 RepID=UPI0015CD7A57|nr:hypothetical protein [Winogradskyella vidalii]